MTTTSEPRKELHFRRIDMRGYQRANGLFELEGRVTDRKPHDFVPHSGGRRVPAGEPLHDMGVRLVFDAAMVVREISTFTNAAPYELCPDGGGALQAMIGVRMSNGWTREVRSRLGGARSCAHLMELLLPMATAAFQSLSEVRRDHADALDETGRPKKIDSCYAYGAEREIVLQRWPQFHKPNLAKD